MNDLNEPDELTSLLDEILLAVAHGKHRHPDRELTAFFPAKGHKSVGDLMVVGRAPNGWDKGWRPQDALDSQRRREIIQNVLPSTSARRKCPMFWISDLWSKDIYICPKCKDPAKLDFCDQCGPQHCEKVGHNNKSAFFRVMKSATEVSKIADTSTREWASYLIWTDLYKIAPFAGGNPSSGLKKMQHDLCIQMLKEELRQWKPRRLLFLTGLDWAEPFLAGIGVTNGSQRQGWVSYSGKVIAGDTLCSVVVTPHPERKPEGPITIDIGKAFAELEKP